MLCVDVNVLVYAHRQDLPGHEGYRGWLDEARRGRTQLGVPGVVVSGFVRVVTNARIFTEPSDVRDATTFARALLASPAVVSVPETDAVRATFLDLCEQTDSSGDRVPDAWLAALAMSSAAVLVTADRGFGRFPGLRWRDPVHG